jgi:hypothetical protein
VGEWSECMPACALELGKAPMDSMKAAHHRRPSARSVEVDLGTCHAYGEETPADDTHTEHELAVMVRASTGLL